MDYELWMEYNREMDGPQESHGDLEPDMSDYKDKEKDFYTQMSEEKWIPEASRKGITAHGRYAELNENWSEDSSEKSDIPKLSADPTNPSHYKGSVPKALEHHNVVYAHNLDYHIGCATKYLFRAGKKSSTHLSDGFKEVEDLEKARTYIKMKIDILKNKLYPDNDW